jgi:hypothetical protein
LWLQEQAARLAALEGSGIDTAGVAEELVAVGNSDLKEAMSFAALIVAHILKLQCSDKTEPHRKWTHDIEVFRRKLKRCLAESPSLLGKLESKAEDWNQDGLDDAVDSFIEYSDTGTLPVSCSFTLPQVLGDAEVPVLR